MCFTGLAESCRWNSRSGRSVIGWLKYYSDRPDNAGLFLERASWVPAGSTTLVSIDGPGILLTSECGMPRSISFLRYETGSQDKPADGVGPSMSVTR